MIGKLTEAKGNTFGNLRICSVVLCQLFWPWPHLAFCRLGWLLGTKCSGTYWYLTMCDWSKRRSKRPIEVRGQSWNWPPIDHFITPRTILASLDSPERSIITPYWSCNRIFHIVSLQQIALEYMYFLYCNTHYSTALGKMKSCPTTPPNNNWKVSNDTDRYYQ